MLNTLIQNNPFLIFVLLIFAFGYVILLFKYMDLRSKRKTYEKDALERSQKILDKAIIEASGIISKAQVLGEEVRSKISDSTTQISDNQKDVYQKVLDEVRNQLYEVVQKASQDIKQDAQEEIASFANSVRQETIATESEVKTKISQEYINLERDLEEYKRTKMIETAEQVEKLVAVVSKKVFTESLTPENHKDLILRALEEAKKNNVF